MLENSRILIGGAVGGCIQALFWLEWVCLTMHCFADAEKVNNPTLAERWLT